MPEQRKEQICRDAIRLFFEARYPDQEMPKAEIAWLGIYQVLLWFVEGTDPPLPHITDGNRLLGRRASRIWRRRALKVEEYIADRLGVPVGEVPALCDQLFRLPGYEGLQRQNPLGIAFAGLTRMFLEEFGDTRLEYDLDVRADRLFPGIALPGRSEKGAIDIVGFVSGEPRVLISCKHSLRHDREGDLTSECPVFKAAALRQRIRLHYIVVTNEYDPARVSKAVTDDCIDGVYHVHKRAVTEVCGLNGRMDLLKDLSDLVRDSGEWVSARSGPKT